nr:hypothetical protein Iba_chr14bCG13390 [Ipomoea batatas]
MPATVTNFLAGVGSLSIVSEMKSATVGMSLVSGTWESGSGTAWEGGCDLVSLQLDQFSSSFLVFQVVACTLVAMEMASQFCAIILELE